VILLKGVRFVTAFLLFTGSAALAVIHLVPLLDGSARFVSFTGMAFSVAVAAAVASLCLAFDNLPRTEKLQR
jgi:hypothetical protein